MYVRFQSLAKENKLLRTNVEKLDKENHDLKRSVYELTLKYGTLSVPIAAAFYPLRGSLHP